MEEKTLQNVSGIEDPEKILNKLRQRLGTYKKWIGKLTVTKTIINERKRQFENNFKRITVITGIKNPDDIEGLIGFIEKAKEL